MDKNAAYFDAMDLLRVREILRFHVVVGLFMQLPIVIALIYSIHFVYTSCMSFVLWFSDRVRLRVRAKSLITDNHHHHQFNTHECSMNNKIHEKAHAIIQKKYKKRYKKTDNTT